VSLKGGGSELIFRKKEVESMKTFYWFGIYLLLGLWLIVSPYALGFVENLQAYWNAIASGAVSLVIALAGMYCEREQVREHGFSQKTSKAA
jgi:hypothetical protein